MSISPFLTYFSSHFTHNMHGWTDGQTYFQFPLFRSTFCGQLMFYNVTIQKDFCKTMHLHSVATYENYRYIENLEKCQL